MQGCAQRGLRDLLVNRLSGLFDSVSLLEDRSFALGYFALFFSDCMLKPQRSCLD